MCLNLGDEREVCIVADVAEGAANENGINFAWHQPYCIKITRRSFDISIALQWLALIGKFLDTEQAIHSQYIQRASIIDKPLRRDDA